MRSSIDAPSSRTILLSAGCVDCSTDLSTPLPHGTIAQMKSRPAAMRRAAFSIFLALLASPFATTAQTTIESVPTPNGLSPCPPQSPLQAGLARLASQFGAAPSGCFVSSEQVQLRGTTKTVDHALEFGYVITYAPKPSGPYTSKSIDELFSKTQGEWKNVEPLWKQTAAVYNKRVEDLVRSTSPSGAPQVDMSIEQPTLVSMTRIDAASYVVVSIRKRHISSAANAFDLVNVEGTALVLNNGSLVHLSLSRTLRGSADIQAVSSAITDWAKRWRNTSS